jgi:dihydroxyacetone synthase
VTCDGSVDICNTEDVNTKMRACGWNVLDVADGCYDVEGIIAAFNKARSSTDKPTFINVRTVIGVGSKAAGDAKAHGAAFGADDVTNIKRIFGMNPEEHFVVSDEVYSYFRDAENRGKALESNWQQLVEGYSKEYPELHKEFKRRVDGKLTVEDWSRLIPSKEDFPTSPTPSRKSAGLCCNPLASQVQNLMVGTADLTPSVNMAWKGKIDFQNVNLKI